MKYLLILILVILSSCNNLSKSESDESKIKKVEKENPVEFDILEFEKEKIALLSVIKEIPYDKTNSVIKDYLNSDISTEMFFGDKNPNNFFKVIDSIAVKNKISRKLTASIIYSYQYEMITSDEIIEESGVNVGN